MEVTASTFALKILYSVPRLAYHSLTNKRRSHGAMLCFRTFNVLIDEQQLYCCRCIVVDDSENMCYLQEEAQTFIGQGLSYLDKVLNDSLDGCVQVQVLKIIVEHEEQFITLAKLVKSQEKSFAHKQLETIMEWRKEELQEYDELKALLLNLVHQCDVLKPGNVVIDCNYRRKQEKNGQTLRPGTEFKPSVPTTARL